MNKQLTRRQRFGRFLLGNEMGKLEESVNILVRAYHRGPYVQTPEALTGLLEGVDSQLLDLVMRQRGWETIAGYGVAGLEFTEQDRLLVVDQTRRAFHSDPQAGRAVNAWTDFGFGQRPIVKPDDPALAKVFEEFWAAKRNNPVLNQTKLHESSNDVVTGGEIFFIYWFGFDGSCTIRRLDTKKIARVKYEKGDPDVPLYYIENNNLTVGERQYREVWYPDWRATKEQLEAVELPAHALPAQDLREYTRVVAQRVSYQDINGRGWPTIYRALPWYEEYSKALKSRAAVLQHVAMFPSKLKHKAGSRATDALKGMLQSTQTGGDIVDRNPPPTPGSVWMENEAIARSRMAMTTGAADARIDTMLLLGQGSVGDGLPLGYRGRTDAWQNVATAKVSTVPWQEQMDRYAGIWETAFREMVEIVGGGQNDTFKDYSATISVSRPALMDVGNVVQAMGAVDNAVTTGTLSVVQGKEAQEAFAKLILELYGLSLQEPTETSDDEMPAVVDDLVKKAVGGEVSVAELAGIVWEIARG